MKTIALTFLLLSALVVPVDAASGPAMAVPGGYVPCKAHQNVSAAFPIRALQDGVLRGESSMVLEIDSTGKVTDKLTTSYTNRIFADEMERTVDKWTFDPGYVDGQPVISILNITFEFSVTGIVVYQKNPGALTWDPMADDQYVYYPHGMESLDRKPTATKLTSPIYPQEWITAGRRGSVTIRFYIDENGRTRIPTIVSNTDDLLARAAVAAVKEWQFEPPTQRGQPVLAHAEQVFVFTPPPAGAAKS